MLHLLALREFRTLRIRNEARGPRVAGGVQVYSVVGGIQVYSVTNYSTCCFLLHLQLSKNYIKELSLTQHSNTAYLNNGQTDKRTRNNCD